VDNKVAIEGTATKQTVGFLERDKEQTRTLRASRDSGEARGFMFFGPGQRANKGDPTWREIKLNFSRDSETYRLYLDPVLFVNAMEWPGF
jgi:hypothetical protein